MTEYVSDRLPGPGQEFDPAAMARARRAAARHGWRVAKSRQRTIHMNNHGGLMLIDDRSNTLVRGSNYELTPEDVVEICKEAES